jgi:hypothetical protein
MCRSEPVECVSVETVAGDENSHIFLLTYQWTYTSQKFKPYGGWLIESFSF